MIRKAQLSEMFRSISDILIEEDDRIPYREWVDFNKYCKNSASFCQKCGGSELKEFILQHSCTGLVLICPKCGGILTTISHERTGELADLYYKHLLESKEVKKNEIIKTKEISKNVESIDKEFKKSYNNNIENNKNKKENENMMNTNKMFKGFEFGKADKELVRLSHLGVAIKNANGVFVSLDKSTDELVDVDFFDFDLDGMVYKMPVAHNQLAVGDVIIHNGTSMIVEKMTDNGRIKVIDPVAGESKTIMPTKNMFGFNFFTKITCLMDMSNLGASSENPFGNMMPLLMMQGMSGEKGEGNDMISMMMMMSMMGGNQNQMGGMGDMLSNPMMMMAMMGGDGNMKDMLPMMMMSGMFSQQKPLQEKVDTFEVY